MVYRSHAMKQRKKTALQPIPDSHAAPSSTSPWLLYSPGQVLDSLLYLVIAYILMLVIMTYNVWLFLTILLTSLFSHFFSMMTFQILNEKCDPSARPCPRCRCPRRTWSDAHVAQVGKSCSGARGLMGCSFLTLLLSLLRTMSPTATVCD